MLDILVSYSSQLDIDISFWFLVKIVFGFVFSPQVVKSSATQCGPGPTLSSPESLLEMQILSPIPDLLNYNLYFNCGLASSPAESND